MHRLRLLALVVAVIALLAPAAHVLEMPNKLRIDGPLWLAVQQSLYRGWGPFVGGPAEIWISGDTFSSSPRSKWIR